MEEVIALRGLKYAIEELELILYKITSRWMSEFAMEIFEYLIESVADI